MLQAIACPAQAYRKRNKSSGASVEYRSALESWTDELDLAYTTTDFDKFSSHLATTLYDPTGLQQLYSEEHSAHHFGNQQSGVCPRYLGQHHTYENSESSLTIDPASYGAFFDYPIVEPVILDHTACPCCSRTPVIHHRQPMSPRPEQAPLTPAKPACHPFEFEGKPIPTWDSNVRVSKRHHISTGTEPSCSFVMHEQCAKRFGQLPGRGLCPLPNCGKYLQDLRMHMLTHQTQRPEKCPIPTCEYHKKGFARRHDKNRHALTHYEGTMICRFCPDPAREPFHRADLFKRHLISQHGVEETPIGRERARKRIKHATRVVCGTSIKCSVCNVILYGARDFYEHIDSCILLFVQRSKPLMANGTGPTSRLSAAKAPVVRESRVDSST